MKYVYIFVWVILGAIVVLRAFAGPLYYTSDPIEAWVVDAETGQPIEGAVVAANWQLLAPSLDSSRKLRQLDVMETTTDAKGRFFFPGFTKLSLTFDRLGDEDPRIHVFKSGYKYSGTLSEYRSTLPGSHRRSIANGYTFTLRRITDAKEYGRDISFLTTSLSPIVESRYGSEIPRMNLTLYCEMKKISKIDARIPVSVPVYFEKEPRCAE